jgi:uncharacterized membrane protein
LCATVAASATDTITAAVSSGVTTITNGSFCTVSACAYAAFIGIGSDRNTSWTW